MNHGQAGGIPFRTEYLGDDTVVARNVAYLAYRDAVDVDCKALPLFAHLLAIFAGTRQHGHTTFSFRSTIYNPLYFFACAIPPPFAVQNIAFNPDFRLSRQVSRVMTSSIKILKRLRAGMALAASPAIIISIR